MKNTARIVKVADLLLNKEVKIMAKKVIQANPLVETFDNSINLMKSKDYKERFIAEYVQTKYRYLKLHHMLIKSSAGTLGFKPTCPIKLLVDQKAAMGEYLKLLEIRAQFEKITLPVVVATW